MKTRKVPRRVTILICSGLLMSTMPMLFKDYIHIPDFVRGSLAGLGIGLEFTGLFLSRKIQKANGTYVCGKNEVEAG